MFESVQNKMKKSFSSSEELFEYFRGSFAARCVDPREEIGPVVLLQTESLASDLLRHKFPFTGGTAEFADEINWLAAPENDLEWTCSLSRHPHLPVLAREYAATGDERFADEVISQMLDWIHRVPRISPESMEYLDIKRSNWRPMEVALRIAEHWPQAIKHVIKSKAMSPEAWATILASIYDQTDYLRCYRWVEGNHAFIEASAIASVGLMLPEFTDAEDWFAEGLEFLKSHWTHEFYPDGYTREMSGGYHWVCYRGHFALYEQAKHLGCEDRFSDEYVEQLKSNVCADFYQMKPTMTAPITNDSAWRPNRQAVIRRAAKTLGLAEIESFFEDRNATNAKPSHLFPDAHTVIFRSGWAENDRYLFFDAGAVGIAHQNTDQLCVEVTAFGRDLILNSGRFRYLTSPDSEWRKAAAYFRSTASTSTVLVDNLNQLPGDATLTCTKLNDSVEYACAEFSAGYGLSEHPQKASYRREIFFAKPDFWIVRDTISFDGRHNAEQLWNLVPGAVVMDEKNLTIRTCFDDANVILCCIGTGEMTMRLYEGSQVPYRGWAATQYGSVMHRPQICFEQSGESGVVFHTLIFPVAGPVTAIPQFELTENEYCISYSAKRIIVPRGTSTSFH